MKTAPRLASATLAAIAVIAAPGIAPSSAAAACDPATRALQYLNAHRQADGSLDHSIAETSDLVLGVAAGGYDPNAIAPVSGQTPYAYLAADVASAIPKSYADANQLGKLIQAVVAGHRDAEAFGGQHLLGKLTTATGSGGMYDPATGAYLDSTHGSNQAFAQAQAILALAAARQPAFPIPAKAVTELKSLRATGGVHKGGWSAFGSYDTNTTSMALMALAAAGDSPANDAAVYNDAFGFLHSQQDPTSGGFLFSTDFSTASDPDSDALVIQALVASGEHPDTHPWSNSNGSAVADILTFQDPTGGFAFEHGGKVQAFATSQVPAGLKEVPFPVPGAYTAGATIPGGSCAAVAAASASPAVGLPAAGRPAAAGMERDAWSAGVVLAAFATLGLLAVRRWARTLA